jgi:hypothetical protein
VFLLRPSILLRRRVVGNWACSVLGNWARTGRVLTCRIPLDKQGLKIAVVVNDVAKVNIDSKLVRERTGTGGDENMADCVELQVEERRERAEIRIPQP